MTEVHSIRHDREPGNGVAEAGERAPIIRSARTDGGQPAGPACDPANPALGPGDPVQRAHHDRDLQADRPTAVTVSICPAAWPRTPVPRTRAATCPGPAPVAMATARTA